MSNAVRLQLAVDADTSDAAAAFDRVGQAAKDMSNDVSAAARDADSATSGLNDSIEGAGSTASQAAGGFGDLGGALAMMPGPLGAIGAGMETVAPAIMGVTGAADLLSVAMNSQIVTMVKNTATTIASTVAQTAASAATKTWTAVQWLLNAALSANPIGVVIALIVALVAAVILAYKNSETFRNIVQKLGQVAVAAFGAIVDAISTVVSWLSSKLQPVIQVVMGIVKTEVNLARAAIDLVVGVVQDLIRWIGKIVAPIDLEGIFNGIKDAVGFVIDKVESLITWVGKIVKPIDLAAPFNAAKDAVGWLIDKVESLISWLGKIKVPSIHIPGVGKSAAVTGATTTRGPAPGLTAAGAAGGGVTINVYGATDPYQTARQLQRIMVRGAIIGGKRNP